MENRIHGIDDAADNTCDWLVSHPRYEQWLSSRSGLLWIKGKPGAGKSTLMKYAVKRGKLEGHIASFFFHDRGTTLEKTARGMYQSLLHQLLHLGPNHISKLAEIYEERCNTRGGAGAEWTWHERELRDSLKDLLLGLSKQQVRIYVDALDEAGEEAALKLVDFFESLIRQSESSKTALSICFSCRHYPILSFDYGLSLCVEEENSADIANYVHEKLSQSKIGEDMAQSLRKAIITRANGVFQWIILVVPVVLRHCRLGKRLQYIQTAIEQIPQRLEDLYKATIQNTPEDERPHTLRLMQWLCFAPPCSLPHLSLALIVEKDTPYNSLAECFNHSEFYAENYEGMERLIKHFSRGMAEVSGSYVQFVHQSAKDYLIEGGLRLLEGNIDENPVPRGHINMAWSCIRYLSMTDIPLRRPGRSSTSLYPFSMHDLNLMTMYASGFGFSHVLQAQDHQIPPDELLELCRFFHSAVKKDRYLLHIMFRYQRVEATDSYLHLLVWLNFYSVLDSFLSLPDVVVDERDEQGHTALLRAAECGHERSVEALLEHGANTSLADERGMTPLMAAAEYGHPETIQLLLEHKADTSLVDEQGRTALLVAAENWSNEVIRLLLKHGADPSLADVNGRTPLMAAAKFSRNENVQLLLEHGADHSLTDVKGRTALMVAAKYGQSGAMQLLLDRGTDPSLADVKGRTALIIATKNWGVETAKLLLEYGANPSAADAKGRTALLIAVDKWIDVVVRLLLKYGANSSSLNMKGRTALSTATEKGRTDIVKLFLENGADVSVKDSSGMTPLMIAKKHGFGDIVRLLKKHSAGASEKGPPA
jgi:ankyrin repeat protein